MKMSKRVSIVEFKRSSGFWVCERVDDRWEVTFVDPALAVIDAPTAVSELMQSLLDALPDR